MKYGSVYTPDSLADFVVSVLSSFLDEDGIKSFGVCIDPSCGGFSLLEAVSRSDKGFSKLIGIDFDPDAVELSNKVIDSLGLSAQLHYKDFLVPSKKLVSSSYWTRHLGTIDTIIANPPWSSERIYDKADLEQHGFTLANGQYDSYFLFTELSLAILKEGGFAAFILPDSLFSATAKNLRAHLLEKYQIKLIARLGEKLFPDVFRATAVLVLKKAAPHQTNLVSCFRLSPDDRSGVLGGTRLLYDIYRTKFHLVPQSRFTSSSDFLFDIDTTMDDLSILEKIQAAVKKPWTSGLGFGRGVEISKAGTIYVCPKCGKANCISRVGTTVKRTCRHCNAVSTVEVSDINSIISTVRQHNSDEIVLVGESINRYRISNPRYLALEVKGIKYKSHQTFEKPKLLIRKTGLGIKAAVDVEGVYTTQSVYFFFNRESNKYDIDRLYFYMALLNSRVIYYYYMKCYGENEWKSHPYLTKRVLEQLPLVSFDPQCDMHLSIARSARKLMDEYSVDRDLRMERMIERLYLLDLEDVQHISCELNNLPDLRALEEMKL